MALQLKKKTKSSDGEADAPKKSAKPKSKLKPGSDGGGTKKAPLKDLKKKPGGSPAKQEGPKVKKKASGGFLKRGKAAKEALEAERQAAAVREAQRENEVFRFWLKPGEEKRITFLDGDLDEDGDIDGVFYYEHTINNPAQKYPKYVCINDPANGSECPICKSGDQPYFAAVFTVLVHDTWHSKKEDKDYEGSIRLFVAKQGAYDKLRQKAKKYGSLKGATYDVTRTGKDAYRVGDDFDYLGTNTLDEIAEAFPDCCEGGKLKIPDYDLCLPVFDADELIKMGFGSKTNRIGGESSADEDEVL